MTAARTQTVTMPRVVIESPYAGTSWFPPLRWLQRIVNVRYARKCVRDSLARGEAPYASHLFYTQPGILRDHKAGERQWGIDAGLIWGSAADLTAVYTDRGTSKGMRYGKLSAAKVGRPIEYRSLRRGEFA